MPDKTHDSSESSGGLLTRRGVLGLGVATVVIASTRQLAAAGAAVGAETIANQGSVLEFAAGAPG